MNLVSASCHNAVHTDAVADIINYPRANARARGVDMHLCLANSLGLCWWPCKIVKVPPRQFLR